MISKQFQNCLGMLGHTEGQGNTHFWLKFKLLIKAINNWEWTSSQTTG